MLLTIATELKGPHRLLNTVIKQFRVPTAFMFTITVFSPGSPSLGLIHNRHGSAQVERCSYINLTI